VTIFRTAEGEKVVSVERLPDSGGGDEGEGELEGGEGGGEG
jgi:DNA gyrase subunit A